MIQHEHRRKIGQESLQTHLGAVQSDTSGRERKALKTILKHWIRRKAQRLLHEQLAWYGVTGCVVVGQVY